MFKSIFERLFWTNVMVLILVFLSVSAALTIFVNNYIVSRQFDSIMKVSDTIEYWTGYLQVENNDARSRNSYRQTLQGWADFLDAEIVITNNAGEVIEDTGDNVHQVPQEYVKQVAQGNPIKTSGHFGGQYEKKVFTVGIPILYYGNNIGGMYFNTMMPAINRMVTNLVLMFLLASTFSIIVAFGLVYLQSKRISKPIQKINDAAMDIAAGNFDERVNVTSTDEIGQLASTFNFMADSLEKLEDMRSRFVSDVSHELRTPMTSISGFVEGILDGTIPPENQEKYLRIVLDESVRLTKMVNDMLEMTKMSSSEYKLDISDFDINELIRLCIISLEQKIENKPLDLDVDFAKDSIKVCADRNAIQRVVLNLMDNAIKFSYPNTTMGLKTWVADHKAYIQVGNFGEGIASANLSHIFDRFYKTDESRTKNKSGAGLGLSFVKNIMVLHKQSVWVESREPKEGSNVKYTTFTFTLELA